MKLLILSFYYQPDLSAGSFRTTALVKALLEKMPADAHIELITTLPNRYSTFSSEAPEFEEHPRLTIHRIALPAHKSGMVDQAKAFLVYAKHVRSISRGKHYDLVYATSSRLMTATLGAFIARSKKTALYLDIRDIFVDTITDVLPGKMVRFIKPFLSLLEHFTIKSARKVNLVSAGFLPYFKSRYPDQTYSLFTNGIDDEFLSLPIIQTACEQDRILDVVYAGNIGEGQGLHNIIPQLAKHFEGTLRFKVIGDGGRHAALKEAINAANCNNVDLLSPVKRDKLINVYQSADILFLHLNDYDAFRKVLPSKLFEYAAMGKPIWAGIGGYAADFVSEHVENASVFAPCDADAAVESFKRLEMSATPRAAFVDRFARANIMREMAADVISVTEMS
ncbi:glycosyltransferase family 4 protein [Pseudomonas moorei]|uniref:Glycosyltransferase involved in cell wall bisynthesis n=1 Tax=Pseudomonas moorei TaxID=395599 RepID=A0A1H0Z2H3_9PSED|nr:glycosyltransferase family 4 protein [Pseudomonas moorei]KAB0498501.1 glycosyltransferase family 4 protein [Pseudomonas moorei]SDQ21655.1 Glycosyltransferase involved in cell wall bisynthesis [Pseudomonas moorei]